MLTSDPNRGVGAIFNGVDRFSATLKKEQARQSKAMNAAIRVEGFRLKNLLQAEIRKGEPGGQRMTPLSYIARRYASDRRANRAPLERMALGVRYHVVSERPYALAVGWVGPVEWTSKRWRRLAQLHQEGFTRTITGRQRRWLARRGGELGKIEGGDTPFFLRKTTRTFNTPARPMMHPFWQAYREQSIRNIHRNFKRKAAGKTL